MVEHSIQVLLFAFSFRSMRLEPGAAVLLRNFHGFAGLAVEHFLATDFFPALPGLREYIRPLLLQLRHLIASQKVEKEIRASLGMPALSFG